MLVAPSAGGFRSEHLSSPRRGDETSHSARDANSDTFSFGTGPSSSSSSAPSPGPNQVAAGGFHKAATADDSERVDVTGPKKHDDVPYGRGSKSGEPASQAMSNSTNADPLASQGIGAGTTIRSAAEDFIQQLQALELRERTDELVLTPSQARSRRTTTLDQLPEPFDTANSTPSAFTPLVSPRVHKGRPLRTPRNESSESARSIGSLRTVQSPSSLKPGGRNAGKSIALDKRTSSLGGNGAHLEKMDSSSSAFSDAQELRNNKEGSSKSSKTPRGAQRGTSPRTRRREGRSRAGSVGEEEDGESVVDTPSSSSRAERHRERPATAGPGTPSSQRVGDRSRSINTFKSGEIEEESTPQRSVKKGQRRVKGGRRREEEEEQNDDDTEIDADQTQRTVRGSVGERRRRSGSLKKREGSKGGVVLESADSVATSSDSFLGSPAVSTNDKRSKSPPSAYQAKTLPARSRHSNQRRGSSSDDDDTETDNAALPKHAGFSPSPSQKQREEGGGTPGRATRSSHPQGNVQSKTISGPLDASAKARRAGKGQHEENDEEASETPVAERVVNKPAPLDVELAQQASPHGGNPSPKPNAQGKSQRANSTNPGQHGPGSPLSAASAPRSPAGSTKSGYVTALSSTSAAAVTAPKSPARSTHSTAASAATTTAATSPNHRAQGWKDDRSHSPYPERSMTPSSSRTSGHKSPGRFLEFLRGLASPQRSRPYRNPVGESMPSLTPGQMKDDEIEEQWPPMKGRRTSTAATATKQNRSVTPTPERPSTSHAQPGSPRSVTPMRNGSRSLHPAHSFTGSRGGGRRSGMSVGGEGDDRSVMSTPSRMKSPFRWRGRDDEDARSTLSSKSPLRSRRKGGRSSSMWSVDDQICNGGYKSPKIHKPTEITEDRGGLLKRGLSDIRKYYAMGQKIGEGRTGVVVYQCSERSTGNNYACKSIAKTTLSDDKKIEALRREVQVMEMLRDHPTVVTLKEALEDDKDVHLVMEICEGGDLLTFINSATHISEKQAATMCRSLARAVRFCHSAGVVHRDLKPENILMASRGSWWDLRLADFGICAFVKPGEMLKGYAGSAFYISPEVLRGTYSQPVDVWSLGVILYVLLSQKLPFWSESDAGVYRQILRGDFDISTGPWTNISAGAKSLVERMLTLDPQERISLDAVIDDPWVQANASEEMSLQNQDSSWKGSRRRRAIARSSANIIASFRLPFCLTPPPEGAEGEEQYSCFGQ